MTPLDATSPPVLPIGSKPSHLAVALPPHNQAATQARAAQQNLFTLDTLARHFAARAAQRRGRVQDTTTTLPPLAVDGDAAFLLERLTQRAPRNQARTATQAELRVLSAPPQFVVAEGDLAHVQQVLTDLGPRWLTAGWHHRVLCAAPPTDDAASLVALERAGKALIDLPQREQALVAARRLARGALPFHTSIRIALHTGDRDNAVYARFPVLTLPGLELASWSRFCEYLGRRSATPDPAVETEVITRLATTVLRVRDIQQQRAKAGPRTPEPQDTALTVDATDDVRKIVGELFRLALTRTTVSDEVARRLGAEPHVVVARLADTRRVLAGRHLHLVRGDDA